MSEYGDIADRFVQGYHVGERMRANRLKRQEADAYTAMEEADMAARGAIPVEGEATYSGPIDQAQGANTAALDLTKGQTAASGGTMDAKTGLAASPATGAIPDAAAAPRPVDTRTGMAMPEGADRFSQDIQTDPKYFDAVRAARSKYLKAVGANDSGRALMLKKYFEENDQQEIVDSLYKASALAEAGDEAGASRYALHAYGMIDDGGAAQIRKVNGRLIGVGFDQKTGELRNMMSLDPESLFKLATKLKDPLAYRQILREDKQDKMAEESHGLEMDTGREALAFAKEANPLKLKEARLQLQGAQKELDIFDRKWEMAQEEHEDKRGVAQAQSMYYLSKALGLDGAQTSAAGFKTAKDWQAFNSKLSETSREVMAGMAGDESMEGAWAANASERDQSRVISKAMEYTLTGIKAGDPASMEANIQAAIRITAFEDMLEGGEADNATIDRYAEEHQLNAVWDEKTNMLRLDVDGMPVLIPPRGNDKVLAYIAEKSQQTAESPDSTPEEKAEAQDLLVKLGEVLGRAGRSYMEGVQERAALPPGGYGMPTAGLDALGAGLGMAGDAFGRGIDRIEQGIDIGYGE